MRADPNASDVRAALNRVTASPAFQKANQLASFLRYVVEEALAGRGERLKAYTIATSALGRDNTFDPQTDPIVRVEAGRLRRALDQYYGGDGCNDLIVIELPIGSYVPSFRCLTSHGREWLGMAARQGGRSVGVNSRQDQGFDGLADVLPQVIALCRTIGELGQIQPLPFTYENTDATAIEVVVMLDDLIAKLTRAGDLRSAVEAILDAAIKLHDTNLGNIQLFDEKTGDLTIIAQRGFKTPFLEFFASVSASDSSACARALLDGGPVIIADVEQDEGFAPYRAVAAEAGFRAVQSTPLITSAGEIVGMLSTHFPQPHEPSRLAMLTTQLYARLAADAVVRLKTSGA